MFKNAFANLQKVGKSLMLPVSVLPIAGILLGVGSANFSWLPAVVSHVMAEAGGSVFANMPLIFAIGVALGFTNNDGVCAGGGGGLRHHGENHGGGCAAGAAPAG